MLAMPSGCAASPHRRADPRRGGSEGARGMKCPSCGHENREQAKFCEECARPIRAVRACSHCGAELRPAAKFCDECATPTAPSQATPILERTPRSYTPKHLADKILTSRSALEGERKQVTVLFA